jgi:hypothetical protein
MTAKKRRTKKSAARPRTFEKFAPEILRTPSTRRASRR